MVVDACMRRILDSFTVRKNSPRGARCEYSAYLPRNEPQVLYPFSCSKWKAFPGHERTTRVSAQNSVLPVVDRQGPVSERRRTVMHT